MAPPPSPDTHSVSEAVGVDLGGTKLLTGVVGEGPEVLHRSERSSLGQTSDEVMAALEAELHAAVAAHPDVAAIGLGVPCTIDHERGLAIQAVNLPITDLPIRDLISDRLSLPVSIDNDGNTAALAEHRWGAARGSRNAVLLTIGTGIGGGLILGGEVYRGSSGAGAELGHMVIDQDGPPCQGSCPNRGCLEALASGTALGQQAGLAAARNPESALGKLALEEEIVDGRQATIAALAGDRVAIQVVATIGRRLGAGLSSIANIFEPEVIVVGGGVMAAGELLLGPARDEMQKRALVPMNKTPVVPAELGPEAGMIGAAAMAMIESGA